MKLFKIGELSELFNIGVDSIRYYEKVGLLHPRVQDIAPCFLG